MSNNGEPQPEASLSSGHGSVSLAKTIEHLRQEFRTNPLTRIFDNHLNVRIHALELDRNSSLGRSKFHGVRKKIPDYLLQLCRVARNWSGIWLKDCKEFNVFRFRSRANGVNSGFNYLGKCRSEEHTSELQSHHDL